jgi:hypothetical protein
MDWAFVSSGWRNAIPDMFIVVVARQSGIVLNKYSLFRAAKQRMRRLLAVMLTVS